MYAREISIIIASVCVCAGGNSTEKEGREFYYDRILMGSRGRWKWYFLTARSIMSDIREHKMGKECVNCNANG